jgi:tRNA A-37 threonylcarbamoyl transferase component Bud32
MATDFTGKTFGSYKLVETLGRGGMASVYRGYQESIDRSVAVKVLPPEYLHDPSFSERFVAEARVLAKLVHPSIMPLYDFGTGEVPYIVMPLMAHGTLGDRLGRGPVAMGEVLRVVEPIASALDYAHGQGVIHRDLKPSNILFDQNDTPYLGDFGIAKALEATSGLTGTGIIGTPEYMSPEQAQGEVLDGRSDIYALAVVVYQLLTGEQLFKATTPMGVVLKHVTEPPPTLRVVRPDLPEAMDTVLRKALAKKRDQRYQTACEFIAALSAAARPAEAAALPSGDDRAMQATLLVGARPSTPGTPMPRPSQARPATPGTPVPPVPPVSQVRPPTSGVPVPGAAPAPRRGGIGGFLLGSTLGVVVGVVLILLVVAACCAGIYGIYAISITRTPTEAPTEGLPTETATPPPPETTPTLEATATPGESPTPPPAALETPTALVAGENWIVDTFDSNTYHWTTGVADDKYATIDRQVTGGKYSWTIKSKQGVVSRESPTSKPVADFVAAVEVQRTSGDSGRAGLTFREDNNSNYYYFSLADHDQKYGFFVRMQGKWTTLIDMTTSTAIRVDGPNWLAVQAQGSHFKLYINSTLVAETDDSSLTGPGWAGIAAEMDANLQAVFEYDNFRLGPPDMLLFTDDLSKDNNTWGTKSDADAQRAYVDGQYQITVVKQSTLGWSTLGRQFGDFEVDVRATQLAGPNINSYGLLLRYVDDADFYRFALSGDGSYSFYEQKNNQWVTLIDWKKSGAIIPGQATNVIRVICQGDTFTFYVNNVLVDKATNGDIAAGDIGLTAGKYKDPASTTVSFADFRVWAVK